MNKPLAMVGTLFALTFASVVAFAQTPPVGGSPDGRPPDPQMRITQISKDLGLTDAQKPQLKKILDEERTNLMASMKQEREQNIDVQTAHQNHQKIEDAAMAKLKPVLSDAQYKKYQDIVEAEAYARHHRAPAAAPTP